MTLLAGSIDERLFRLRWRTPSLGSMCGSFMWPPHCDQSLMTPWDSPDEPCDLIYFRRL
jgi:hypothetical protein